LEDAVPRGRGLLSEGWPGARRAAVEHLGAGGRRAGAHRGARPAHATAAGRTSPTVKRRTMCWTALLLGVCCVAGWQGGEAQGRGARVAGRVTILQKHGKPATDLGAAVLYLEAGAALAARPVTVEIAINDKDFVPRVVAVPVGSTVRFANHDPFDHNVFSASEPDPFDLGEYGRGETRGFTFTSPGLVRIFCNVHPRMVAFAQVLATAYYTQPAVDGSFAVDGVPPGEYTLHAWHERSPEITQAVTVGAAHTTLPDIRLDARGFRWTPHKNKHGKDYPTNAGVDRY